MSRIVKKYYYLALLGLIPGFGILIGAYLLIYTTIKFRNLKLASFIVVNVLVGIVIMRVDSYYLSKSQKDGRFDNGFKVLTQINLDSLQTKILMFKDYTGSYPDSLMQVKKLIPDADITDDLLEVNDKGTGKSNFYYEKTADSFIVFSAGIDRIPHTKDDLYPRKKLK